MIQVERSEVGYIDAASLNAKEDFKKVLRQQLFDLIIDCNNIIPDTSILSEIYLFQKKNNRCLVLILPLEKKSNYPEYLNLVPTKTEALDFISFEQIQRDLGF